jgi:hypothetical protein
MGRVHIRGPLGRSRLLAGDRDGRILPLYGAKGLDSVSHSNIAESDLMLIVVCCVAE